MFAAVLFDLDNTLIDRDRAFRALVRASLPFGGEVLDELVALDGGGYGERGALFRRWSELGGGRLDSQQFALAIASHVRPQGDLLRALRMLSDLAPLAIISNGGVAGQMAKWRAAGLDAVVPRDRVWVSEAVGLRKPDPAIFQLACTSLNVAPRDCLYVGDQPRIDIAGAQAAGMSTRLTTSPLRPQCILRLGRSILNVECKS
ncbi:MAG: HAD family hydrolase [Pirellulaceae bacterium]